MKIIVTTSDKYHHLLPVFFYLYNKYWGEPFELVGYKEPEGLPENCTWVSLGEQGDIKEWSTDLISYFIKQPKWFVWMMEDTFLKSFSRLSPFIDINVGKVCLTDDVSRREHEIADHYVLAGENSNYRLSLQPSIWNKNYLLQYLTPGLSPWEFETQNPKNDGWDVIGFLNPPVKHNEGVRKNDIYKLDLEGMKAEDIEHINKIYEHGTSK